MPNLINGLKSEITRLAKKEAKKATSPLRKKTTELSRALSASKQQVASLEKEVARLKKQLERTQPDKFSVSTKELEKARFGPTLLKSQRKRLKINQHQMAKLMNASVASIRAWEQGRAKPRNKEVLVSLVAIRKMAVGEVQEKLGVEPKPKKTVRRRKKRIARKAGAKKKAVRRKKRAGK